MGIRIYKVKIKRVYFRCLWAVTPFLAFSLTNCAPSPVFDNWLPTIALMQSQGGGGNSATSGSGGTAGVVYTATEDVTGLSGSLTLSNGNEEVTVNTDGSFSFPVHEGTVYDIQVTAEPPGQDCIVSDGNGTANEDINDITVNCITDVTPPAILSTSPAHTETGVDPAPGHIVINLKIREEKFHIMAVQEHLWECVSQKRKHLWQSVIRIMETAQSVITPGGCSGKNVIPGKAIPAAPAQGTPCEIIGQRL